MGIIACIMHCLIHWKYYMHLFRNCNSINVIRTLERIIPRCPQSSVHMLDPIAVGNW